MFLSCSKLYSIMDKREEQKRKQKNTNLKQNYSITIEDYDLMLEKQNHCCAICHEHETSATRGSLFVDHDHTSKRVRSLLCNRCNLILGYCDDNPKLLQRIIEYLKLTKEIIRE